MRTDGKHGPERPRAGLRPVSLVREAAVAGATAHAGDVIDVDVNDPGVLHDLDEPGDYERLFNRPR